VVWKNQLHPVMNWNFGPERSSCIAGRKLFKKKTVWHGIITHCVLTLAIMFSLTCQHVTAPGFNRPCPT
jgi:hypothetical protein